MKTPAAPSSPVSGATQTPENSATDISRWFAAEVHPHEVHLRNYLKSAFPSESDYDEVVQESYLRVWRSRAIRPIQSAKAFLFKVARHVALDRLRRDHIAPVRAAGDLGHLPVIDDTANTVESVTVAERFQLFSNLLAQLPTRSREVVILCKLQGLSHREAALRLGISEKTVDEHLLRGMKRLGQSLREHNLRSLYDA
ncbi:MAG TPA: RNA polymerase sigma factor [Opitutaceae bacterium]|nr:RNA polymerase sigma factor [Opitutaceae bacterium]